MSELAFSQAHNTAGEHSPAALSMSMNVLVCAVRPRPRSVVESFIPPESACMGRGRGRGAKPA